jgi:CheY-like chemotaxis protein
MSRPLRIAVAEDERDTREYFQELLQRQGHEVAVATDGRQLVELCRDFRPDVVVTDYRMPGLDGLPAAIEINRERPVPVILFTGRSDLDLTTSPGGECVVAVLTKPVRPENLIAAVAAQAARAGA